MFVRTVPSKKIQLPFLPVAEKKATFISLAYTPRSDGPRLIITQTGIQAVRVNDPNQTTMSK